MISPSISGVSGLFFTFCKWNTVLGPFLIEIYGRLSGFPPYYDDDTFKLYEMIKNNPVEFPSPYWDEVSESAKDLIRKLLVKDPKKRIKPDEILAHPWMASGRAADKSLPQVLAGIEKINARKKFKVFFSSPLTSTTNVFSSVNIIESWWCCPCASENECPSRQKALSFSSTSRKNKGTNNRQTFFTSLMDQKKHLTTNEKKNHTLNPKKKPPP